MEMIFHRTFPTCMRTAALELHSNTHRLPLCYSLLNFIAGLAFLLLILSSGSSSSYNHTISFIAVIILCGTGLLQVVVFSYLYFKNANPESSLVELMSALRTTRPFLITAFAIPALMMLMFVMLVTVCAVDIVTSRSHPDSENRNLLPDYYNVGMGAAIVVFQVFPMLVHHDLLLQIGVLRKSYENGTSGSGGVTEPRVDNAPAPPPPYHLFYWNPPPMKVEGTVLRNVSTSPENSRQRETTVKLYGPPPVYESWV